eukprot:8211955-Alexandrium_andersonii.AAC.1
MQAWARLCMSSGLASAEAFSKQASHRQTLTVLAASYGARSNIAIYQSEYPERAASITVHPQPEHRSNLNLWGCYGRGVALSLIHISEPTRLALI